ncbi:acyltransferase [Vibrio vulnificus]|nr:acyltransferase [Vibrio vulnificus]MCU8205253.1 acyltransferase [Vibrio vulnificus]
MDDIKIGNDVMIGPEVMILTGGHDYKNRALLLREQKILTAPVSIGNDCWIGSRVIILPGVSICDRVIVGAGSVVSKSIQEPGIYAGNPAKKIKDL